ncbi:MAG: GvpL/GvpF family gas vesicle protein, partial [candidate division NC10 bacterium]
HPLAPAIRGLGGMPVYLIPWRTLAALVSDASSEGYPADPAHATCHAAVVEAAMQGGPILPVRFGTLLGGTQRVISMLEEHSATFEESLQRLRGRVEMGLKVLWEAGAAPPVEDHLPSDLDPAAGPGRRYLFQRLGEEQTSEAIRVRGEGLIQSIQTALDPLTEASRLRRFATPRLLLDAAYLVSRERLGMFCEGVERLGKQESGVRCLLSGPWPPYSFAHPLPSGAAMTLSDVQTPRWP